MEALDTWQRTLGFLLQAGFGKRRDTVTVPCEEAELGVLQDLSEAVWEL